MERINRGVCSKALVACVFSARFNMCGFKNLTSIMAQNVSHLRGEDFRSSRDLVSWITFFLEMVVDYVRVHLPEDVSNHTIDDAR